MIILRSKGDMNMKRFLGMMPSTEIEIEKCYKDKDGYKIIIQAGKNGWTIIYADYSTDFKDIISSANKNFEEAYNLAVNRLGTLTENITHDLSYFPRGNNGQVIFGFKEENIC